MDKDGESAGAGLVCLTASRTPANAEHGSETDVNELAGWLHQEGRPVEIVAGGRRAGRDVTDDVPAALLQAWEEKRRPVGLDEASSLVAGLAFRLRRLRPDLVHAFLSADAAAARMADLPYVLGIGGIVSPDTFTGRPGLWQLFVLAAEGARGIVCPSRAAARELAEMFGFDVEVVPDGVETSRFDGLRVERQAGLVVGQLAGDDHRARAELLVDSFPAVAQAVPGAELALLGPTGEVRRRALLDRLPEALRSRVVLTGPLDRIRTAVWYARASVTCLPAVRVAFGRPLAESLAAGTPIVGADDGAVPELLADGDDPTGRVRAPSPLGAAFTADDPVSCARALVTVLGDGHDPSRAEACRGRAARYDWSVVGPLLVDLYGRAG